MADAKTGANKGSKTPIVSGGGTLARMAGRKTNKGTGKPRGLRTHRLPCGDFIMMATSQRPTEGICPTCKKDYLVQSPS